MSENRPLPSLQHLFFDAPLYAVFELPEGKWYKADNLEGLCPHCENDSIFKVAWKTGPGGIGIPVAIPTSLEATCRCVRDDKHHVRFQVMLHHRTIQKWGQFPTFATIANAEAKPLRKFLSQQDGAELYRATGLAAHGIGIGSYVYMRRIFERIIQYRFDEFKVKEGWNDSAFLKMRMDERIDLLRHHLPDFLSNNRKLYKILSAGIHELTEQECLDFFDTARTSILFILDDDRRKKEELAERREAEKAIASYAQRAKSN